MKKYRDYFKDYYNINFGADFEVHHIDLNRKNNDIDNLMILPKKLHHKYHMIINSTLSLKESIFDKTFNAKIHSSIICSDSYNLNMCKELIETLKECNKWYDYKLYLDGRLTNIHCLEIY